MLLLMLVLLALSPAREVHSQADPNEAQVNKQFIPTIIPPGGVAKLRVFIYNPNSYSLSITSLTDNLPAGMTVNAPPNAATTCSGGTVTAVPNSTSFTLTGGTVPPKVGPINSECYFEVDITTTVQGNSINTIPANALTSTGPNGPVTNSSPASATILVESMPNATVTKTFTPTTVYVGQNSTLTIRINNNSNTINMTNVSLTDVLPTGLVINGAATLSGCGGGTVTAPIGGDTIMLTGATVQPSPDCLITVPVYSLNSAVYTNVIPGGSLQSRQGVTDPSNRSATLNVQNLRVEKSFDPASVPQNGITRLRITLRNPTGTPYTGVSLTDNLPSGLVVANPPNLSNTCGGTISGATPASTSFSLSGGTIPAGTISAPGTCIIEIDIQVTVVGLHTNTIPANSVTTNEGATNINAGSATVTGTSTSPGNIGGSKTFTPNVINPGDISRIRVRLNRSGGAAAPLTGVTFVDNLPANVVIANPPNITFTNCGNAPPAMTRNDPPAYTPLSGGETAFLVRFVTVPASGNCDIEVNVTSTVPGIYTNTIPANSITNDQGTTNTGALTATLTVRNGLEVTKEFLPSTITTGGYSTVRITLTNRNNFALTGVNLTDPLPNTGARQLRVRNPANASTTCGSGVVTATPGSDTVTLTGGEILAQVGPVPGTCTITFDVVPFGSGPFTSGSTTNTIPIGNVTSAQGIGNLQPASATLNFANLTMRAVKEFDPTLVYGGADSLLTITLTNQNSIPLTQVSFTDNFPTGMFISAPVFTNTNCAGGVVTANAGDGFFTFSGGTIPANGSCVVQVRATINVNGNLTNVIPAGQICAKEGVCNPDPIAASLTNLPGVSISKVFVPSTIAAGGTSTLVITIRDTGGLTLTNASATDTLPTGLSIASPANPSTTCALGNVTTTTNSVTLSGATVPANGSCTFQVDVTGTVPDSYVNTIPAGALTNDQGASNPQPATATLTITPAPPSITKSFTPANINVGGTSTLTLVITNPNPSTTLTGVAVTDNFPAGMSVASPPSATNTCGGTFAPNAGDTSIALSGGSIPGGGNCTLTVNVTVNADGTYVNTTGNVTSANGGTGNSASATLTTVAPPSITKAFSPTSIPAGGVSTITLTITNPNATTTLTGVAVTDPLPTGMTVASPPNAANTCGGTFAPNAGDTSIALSGGSIPGGGTCTLTVDVTTSTPGDSVNTTGNVTSANGGTGNSASATLTTVAPPSIAKTFSPTSIPAGGVSTITLTITNPNATTALTGVAVTDPLPTGMTVASPPNAANTCGGTFAPNAGDTSIALSGGNIAAGGTCTLTVDVTVSASGSFVNTTGNVTAANGGTGNTATATLTSVAPPSIAKTFSPTSIPAGGVSTIALTITNPNATVALTGVAVTDPLPTGMTVASPPNATNTCGGTFAPNAGDTSIALSGGNIAAGGTCTLTVDVTTSTPGDSVNTTGNVTSANGGTGNSASATLTVGSITPPSIVKSFTPDSIDPGATSTLTLTITNPNVALALTGLAVTDVFPPDMAVAAPLTTTNTCGGSLLDELGGTLDVGDTGIQLTGGTLAPSSTCTITVLVTATISGTNTTGNVSSTNGGTGNTATAALTVSAIQPPSIAKSFTPGAIEAGSVSTITLTITNPNPSLILTGVAVTDPLPTGMTVASPPNATNTCSGTFAPNAGDTSLTLSGGMLAAGGTCTLTVDVTTSVVGSSVNTTGNVTSTNGGTGNSASATLTVSAVLPPSIAKSFSPTAIVSGGTATLTLIISNPNQMTTLDGLSVTDSFPAGMSVAAPLTFTNTCGGSLLDDTGNALDVGDTGIQLTGGSLAPNSTCTITLLVTATQSGTNTTGNVSSTNGGTGNNASAPIAVGSRVADLEVLKSVTPDTVATGNAIRFDIQLRNNGPDAADGATFSDNVPAQVTIISATCSGATGGAVCGGNPTISGQTVTLTIPTFPGGSALTVTINGIVMGNTDFTNTARITPPVDTVDPNEPNNESSVPVAVVTSGTGADMVVTKSVDPINYAPGDVLTYTIVVRNDGPNDVVGGTVIDMLPSALLNPQWSCTPTGNATCASGLQSGNIVDTVDIAAGADNFLTYTVTAVVAPNANAPINNMVYVALPAGFVDPTPENNNAPAVSNLVNLSPTAVPTQIGGIVVVDPVIVKLVDPALALPGELVVYTLTVTNPSNAPATAVVVSDTVPSVLQIIGATTTQGTFTISGQVVIFNIGTVNPGQTVTLTVTARLRDDAPAPSDVTNTGELRHQTGNPKVSSATLRITRGRLPATGLPPAEPIKFGEALGLLVVGMLLIFAGAMLWLRRVRR
jgi:uncharacterized repeat protein (TIGR01451 family)